MFTLFLIFILTSIIFWLLFLKSPTTTKTISAWRWLLFGWGGLISVTVLTPIVFDRMFIDVTTIFYCMLWIAIFCISDEIFFRYKKNNVIITKPNDIHEYFVITCLYIATCTGFAYLLMVKGFDILQMAINDPYALGTVRDNLVFGERATFEPIAVFLATAGLPAAGLHAIKCIEKNKKLKPIILFPLVSYLLIYVFNAGRQGFLISGLTFMILIFCAMQIHNFHYKYKHHIRYLGVCATITFLIYYTIIVNFRTVGDVGHFDWKIQHQNDIYKCDIDLDFLNSVYKYGNIGNIFVEFIYYFSPQLYGLSHIFPHDFREFGFGAVQFPYVARRLMPFIGHDIVTEIEDEIENVFYADGMFHHFFRTAVDNTIQDYGKIGGLLYMTLLGAMCGLVRYQTIYKKDMTSVFLISLCCCGAFFTIIYSPFAELGFGFPLIWILLTKIYLTMCKRTK